MNEKKNRAEWLETQGVQVRRFERFEVRAEQSADEGAEKLYVEGVAAPFDTETVLYEWDGIEFREMIAATAFDECDMSDVIFNYNHSGKVMARTRNKTLEVWTESDGLHIRARLDGTEEGRKLYQEISGGYIDRMSYAYSVAEAAYNNETHLRTVQKVSKLYDVAAVDMPAYESTSISARSSFAVEIANEKKLAAAARLLKRGRLTLLSAKLKSMEVSK